MNQPVFLNRIAAVLPNAPVPNERMEAVLGLIRGRPSRARAVVLRSNGIRNRHYVLVGEGPDGGEVTMNNAQLTAQAVRGLAGAGFSLDHIEVLACGTASPDQVIPGHAVMVHGELGSAPCETMSAAGVCISGVLALKFAFLSIAGGQARTAVATGSETASLALRAMNFAESAGEGRRDSVAFDKEFLRWMLSDGAGAMLVGAKPAPKGLSLRIDWIEMTSYSHAQPACMYAGAEKMPDGRLRGWRDMPAAVAAKNGLFNYHQDVRQLNENIVPLTVDQPFPKVLEAHPMKPGDIDWFLPHMSSEYFRKHTVEAFERVGFRIPTERWFTNLNRVGNVGSASIYLMLEELMRRDDVRVGQRILCLIPESARFSTAYMHLTVVEPE